MRRMLRLDPAERATVPEIFNHFWLRIPSATAATASDVRKDRSGISSNSQHIAAAAAARAVSPPAAIASMEPIVTSENKIMSRSVNSTPRGSNKDIDIGVSGVVRESDPVPGLPAPQVESPRQFKLVPLRRNPTAKNSPVNSPGHISPRASIINSDKKMSGSLPMDEGDSLRVLAEALSRAGTADNNAGPSDSRINSHRISTGHGGQAIQTLAEIDRRGSGSALHSAGTASLQQTHVVGGRVRADSSTTSPKVLTTTGKGNP